MRFEFFLEKAMNKSSAITLLASLSIAGVLAFYGCVDIKGLEPLTGLLGSAASSGGGGSRGPKPEKQPPDVPNLTDGKLYRNLAAGRGRLAVKDSTTGRVYIYPDGGGIEGHEDYKTRLSAGEYSFAPVVSEPVFISACYSRVEDDPEMEVQLYFDMIGSFITFVEGSSVYQYKDVATGESSEKMQFNKDNHKKNFDQTSAYQNGKNLMFFENGQFLSSYALKNEPAPSQVGFSYVNNRGRSFASMLDNTYMATGRMAWGFKEALLDASSNRGKNAANYKSLFNISLSGGINRSKARTGGLKNQVAESKLGYQTIDVKYQISPQLPADVNYPVYINVTFSIHTKEHREITKTLLGMGERSLEADWNSSYDRQHVISSPSDVISGVFSIEYRDSAVNSDMSRTIEMYLVDDPEIEVNVTGMKKS
jgi:hypothetical protein